MNNSRDLDYVINNALKLIKNKSSYKDYIFFKDKLSQDKTLYLKVKNLKEMQYEYIINTDDKNKQYIKSNIDNLYSELMLSDLARGFLNSERNIVKELTLLFQGMISNLQINLDFI